MAMNSLFKTRTLASRAEFELESIRLPFSGRRRQPAPSWGLPPSLHCKDSLGPAQVQVGDILTRRSPDTQANEPVHATTFIGPSPRPRNSVDARINRHVETKDRLRTSGERNPGPWL